MVPAIGKQDTSILPAAWLRDAMSPFDVVATLTSTLPSCWTVERECDPGGDLSIVVLPAQEKPTHDELTHDEPAQPCFILYEENGFVAVATVIADTWHGKQTFPTCRRAVDAILAMAIPSDD